MAPHCLKPTTQPHLLIQEEKREMKAMATSGDFLPPLVMVVVQFLYAGLNITSKLAMEFGMNPLVLVAYRQMFATVAIAPCAYWIERKGRPKITKPILFQILICSLTGATANQVFYYVGLKYSTPTIACALTNVLPAATFVLAVLFRQESVAIKTRPGAAKVLGTVVCVGGAMLLSFYRGQTIELGESGIHWKYAEMMRGGSSNGQGTGSSIWGSLCLIISSVAWAAWFVIQAKVNEKFPAPYTSTALMTFMATIQCGAIAIGVEHRTLAAWSLKSSIRLVGALYAGVACSGLAFCLTSWSIQKKGPLYASVFNPFLLVIVAVFSWTFFQEKLYVGTVVGSTLIVAGLYAVLWGKTKEVKLQRDTEMAVAAEAKLDDCNDKDGLEEQSYVVSNANILHQVIAERKEQENKYSLV
ncbi:WAT1-related protein At1g09380-like [Momordica charantia]|uniref:WAT1-related protein n=1 Tax=Momordica charantia TaxID=3673 RepID=A0A6J1DYQ6_MOMCH|nr:WAT1-related protein At1g09380-like [Momordica charantia]